MKNEIILELKEMIKLGMRGAKLALKKVEEGLFDEDIKEYEVDMSCTEATDLIVSTAKFV